MGIENYLLPSALRMIMGQRLVRKICPHCEETYKPNPKIVDQITEEVGDIIKIDKEKLHLFRGKGCEKCGYSGFMGRLGIYEVMPISPEISEMILNNKSTAEIEEQAKKEGMLTMRQDGILKVVMGVTTLEEVISVIG
jgi:type II secretory ATPase GspE/PulE/Tfp pilus assembly ATPase PilB-like protein